MKASNARFRISVPNLVLGMSKVLDMVSPVVVNHQNRVAFIAQQIGEELGFKADELGDLLMASALHDCGAFCLRERLELLKFEEENPHEHAEIGYRLLHKLDALSTAARIVRHHHVPWDGGGGMRFEGRTVLLASHVIHLADRIEILVDKQANVLGQTNTIRMKIDQNRNSTFAPDHVDAFLAVSDKESFWLSLETHDIADMLQNTISQERIIEDYASLMELTEVFRQIIDFRSRYTATHSAGVAACARQIARLAGLDEENQTMLTVAGHLHDIGKLSVSQEILDKPGSLSQTEYDEIKRHPFLTHVVLSRIKALETISLWCSQHHERLGGKGYPFHEDDERLSIQSRILAISDIFTAITENRPYRHGMQSGAARLLLEDMATKNFIDEDLTALLLENFDSINQARHEAQRKAQTEYECTVASAGSA